MKHRDKPTVVPDIVARFRAVHERDSGIFHILLDDSNYGQGHALFCLRMAWERRNDEAMALGAMLVLMSPTQHKKLHDCVGGVWRKPSAYRTYKINELER